MIFQLLFAIVGRLVVYGAIAFAVGTAVVWFGILIEMMLSGDAPFVASIGG